MSIQFHGLSSGLDTGEIIDQLSAIEARPIQRFEDRIEEAEEVQGAFRDLNNRVSNLHSRVESLTARDAFEPMAASSSDDDIVGVNIVNDRQAVTGSYEVFVESLATNARVRSGAFLQNQKMATEDGETMRSDFRVTGDSRLNLDSEDFLDQLRYNVETTGSGNEDFFVRQDTAEGMVGVSIDLDEVESFSELMEIINDPTIGPEDHAAVLEYDGAGEDRSTLADSENWSMTMQYHFSSDRFTMHAAESSGADGGRTVELADAVGGSGFFQRIGFASDQFIHTFDRTQSEYGENLLSLDRRASLEDAAFQSSIDSAGTIRINNTEVEWDAEEDSLDDVIARLDSEVSGVNVSYNEATDRVTLESSDPGAGEIEIDDLSGNLANVLNLREPGEESSYQSSGNFEAGEDAEVLIDGDPVSSSSNTVTFNGLELELHELYQQAEHEDEPIEIEVYDDLDAVVEEVSRFVDQYNSVIEFINQRSEVDVPSEPGADADEIDSGVFVGQSLPRDLRVRLGMMVTGRFSEPGGDSINSAAQLGIEQVNPRQASARDRGKLEFNASELRAQLEEDPNAVRDFFQASTDEDDPEDGLATRLDDYLAGMTDRHDGIIGNRIDGFDQRINNLQDRIERQTRRVETRQAQLQRQFIQMESIMARLHQQQDSLMMGLGGWF